MAIAHRALFAVGLILTVACSQRAPSADATPTGVAGGAGTTGTTPNPGSTDHAGRAVAAAAGPLLVDQLTTAHGTTAVDTQAPVLFGVRQNGRTLVGIESLVMSSVSLVDKSGALVPISVAREGAKFDPRYDAIISVRPAQALAADHWYELRVTTSNELAFRLQDPADQSGDSAAVRFFTGSAPMVRKLTRYEGEGKPPLLRISFSEPVSLAAFPGALQLAVDGKPVSPCIVSEQGSGVGCLKEKSSIRTEVIQIVLPPGPPSAARAVRVAFPLSLEGSGRTVGEGLAVAGASSADVSAQLVTVHAATGEWFSCEPDATCWLSPRP